MIESRTWGLSGGTLKIIALVTMLIDHATAIFVTDHMGRLYMLGRGIGRLAFPIYCFLIVEGFFHTRNVKKYMIRLFLFALLSEVPFDLAISHSVVNMKHQNVFFTLFFGVLLMYLIQHARLHIDESRKGKQATALIGAYLLVFGLTILLKPDYGVNGIVLILLFFLFHGNKATVAIMNVFMNLFMGVGGIQMYGGISALLIACYNGKKGVSLKYFFYVIYPLHLLVFYLVRRCMG